MHSGDQKIVSEGLKTIHASVETVQPRANFGNLVQMADLDLPLRASSPEPLEKQVTRFSGEHIPKTFFLFIAEFLLLHLIFVLL